MTVPASLSFVGVTKRYGKTVALDDVSLCVRPGEMVALLGPSGAGKSTLFRCATGLTFPDKGRVELFGTDVASASRPTLRHLRRQVGVVFQQFNLIGRLDALSNVLLGRLGYMPTWRALSRLFSNDDRQRGLAALDRVGLLDKAYQRADSLSGGQQQRVAIARALAQEARLVLADEPISSLDHASAERVLDILREIASGSDIAVVVSLHQTSWVQRYADRVLVLDAGHVAIDAEPAQFDDPLRALYNKTAP